MSKKAEGRWRTFIDVVATSKSTEYTYRASLKRFFQCIYFREDIAVEEYADKYFEETRDYEEDVKRFFASIKNNPPKSVRTWLASVKSFLLENDVELPQRFWKRLSRRMKSTRAVTEDIVPSNVQLRQILSHMRIKGKSLYLVLASSGMRIGELLKLKVVDVNLDISPTRINIRAEYTKKGGRRYAFISDEATEALNEWLKVREEKLKTVIARSKHKPPRGTRKKRTVEDQRIFPFTKQSAYTVWNNALDNTKLNGIDERTNRHKIHPHVLRKFFRSRMATIIPVDIVEALMGHEGYLTEVYRRYTPEQLAEFYKKGEPTVTVFGAIGVGQEFIELKKKHAGLDATVRELAAENVDLQTRIAKGQERMVRMQKELNKLRKGDSDIDKIIEVLMTLVNAPLGYSGNKDDPDWFEKEMNKAEKTLKELKRRRLQP